MSSSSDTPARSSPGSSHRSHHHQPRHHVLDLAHKPSHLKRPQGAAKARHGQWERERAGRGPARLKWRFDIAGHLEGSGNEKGPDDDFKPLVSKRLLNTPAAGRVAIPSGRGSPWFPCFWGETISILSRRESVAIHGKAGLQRYSYC
jgi:hypothetical protein